MTQLGTVRVVAWTLVAVIVAAVAVALLLRQTSLAPEVQFGGPFTLTDQNGQTVTEADLAGHPSAIFFGFTFCPDVCPTTLYEASQWLTELGEDGDRLKFYFVTVDPERDTAPQMKSYLSAFDPRIIGLTGERPKVDEMLKAYRVYSRQVPLDGGGYTMDHTASVYLLDARAEFVGTIGYGEDKAAVLEKLKRLLSS